VLEFLARAIRQGKEILKRIQIEREEVEYSCLQMI
jgi:hypothetical protein